jgi:hypothetical protein
LSLFNKPQPPQFLRVLLIGSWSTGKSHVMHTFPGLAVIDTQNMESSHFVLRAEKGEFPAFVSAPAATFEEATKVIKAVVTGGAGNAQTLGIDSLTPLHNEAVQRYSSTTTNGNPRVDWVAVKALERPFGDLIRSVPKHVVATVEPRDIRAKAGERVNGKTVGQYDVVVAKESGNYDDSIGHKFDYIFKMRREGSDSIATCLKAKDETKIARGREIPNLTFAKLTKILGIGAPVETESPKNAPAQQPAADENEPLTMDQRDRIEVLSNQIRLGQMPLGDIVKGISSGRTPLYQSLNSAEANRLIRALEQRAKGAA